MSSWITIPTRVALGATLALLVGCGGNRGFDGDPAEASKRAQLTEIHDIYIGFTKNHNQQPPKKLSDLLKYEKINPSGIKSLKDQTIIFVYGVSPEKGAGSVLAYEKDADKNGGLALLADGTVKKMSADEVKAGTK